jgi:hypothetical protein
MDLSKLCTPAFIYFIVSFVYLVINSLTNFNIMNIIIKMFFIILWSMLLNFLCNKGYTVISWVIIVLPFLFI